MSLTNWEPFGALLGLHDDIDRLFGQNLTRSSKESMSGNLLKNGWMPAVDIHEDKEAYHFDVEIPGLAKDEIQLKVENNVLTLSGERKGESEKKDKNYHRVERRYGSFLRSFTLPENTDSEKVAAEYKNGLLHILIPKKESAKPRQIDVAIK